jgi:hypothetical protein
MTPTTMRILRTKLVRQSRAIFESARSGAAECREECPSDLQRLRVRELNLEPSVCISGLCQTSQSRSEIAPFGRVCFVVACTYT